MGLPPVRRRSERNEIAMKATSSISPIYAALKKQTKALEELTRAVAVSALVIESRLSDIDTRMRGGRPLRDTRIAMEYYQTLRRLAGLPDEEDNNEIFDD